MKLEGLHGITEESIGDMEGISQKRGKKLIICDTNIFIRLFRNNSKMVKELNFLGFDRLTLSSISIAEIYFGMKKNEKRKTKEKINLFNRQEINSDISLLAERMMYEHYLLKPSLPDCFIAATAIYLNAELFTLNRNHFEFYPQLKLYNPKYKHVTT